MPDRRHHRGPHPADHELFASGALPSLRSAVADTSWLLGRGYPPDATLKLVGDRFALAARQRVAVRRMACSDHARDSRAARRVRPDGLAGRAVGVDGYNVLVTLESALSGGLLLLARDGAVRDMASLHGTYRRVEETIDAVRLAIRFFLRHAPARLDWFLDKPVSNSRRLAALLHATHDELAVPFAWEIHLVDDPDRALARYEGVVASSDSVVLDACRGWVDAVGAILHDLPGRPWVIDCRHA